MEEKTSSSDISSANISDSVSEVKEVESVTNTTPVGSEKREAYGTAKTENLRDSGLWRVILPVLVIAFCLALFIIPLIILGPLMWNSITGIKEGNSSEAGLLWVWITMTVVEVSIGVVVARGLLRIFMTQAGNYSAAR